jgi:hypothetical protein
MTIIKHHPHHKPPLVITGAGEFQGFPVAKEGGNIKRIITGKELLFHLNHGLTLDIVLFKVLADLGVDI